ncbi:glutathione S-transferase family protein [Pelomonas sp. KK5]|uniref:glutathione S-transferase family protein n=1 Tax=Pelomonas sp. KK5 TaxID=1855730 RepID=UPI00097BB432|nr:glutathione S-transferase [Pelomonas sp. KK5]
MIKLYDYELSGNCWKVRYLLNALGQPFEKHAINFHPGREHKAAWFIDEVNPLGQIPVLQDGELLLRDAQAILVYLASAYDRGERWYPAGARVRGEIQLWLGVAEDITRSASAARLHDGFGFAQIDVDAARRAAHALFRQLDDHLAGHRWLASTEQSTIADLACFPYAALAPEGGIPLDEYPALRRWVWDFRHQPEFIGMPGILAPGL